MGARKYSGRKIRLMKKTKQASAVPAWVILKTKRTVRTNPKAFGFVLTVRLVFRITHAGTADACFVFFINLIFLPEYFLAPMKFQTDFPLFKSSVILLYKTKYSASG